ncbi:cobyrinate a,c-diamide synthase [Oricola thermophila]|uniref:Hydrogenobyrinate a,c-diamide synthase n=1 Tax=Oricola thermophila TaxID=2742145 RepID=A0A6N1V8X2_9HYPH|nr:cobyrinate a,c-diamide synthase [Oricola thermophila]QKV17410.1 cobyrinate a,c-diamide synthase [Oricola thermophila]
MKGFLVAAPHSGSGKTTLTLGLLRALRDRGMALAPAKAGPDYIDPQFHAAASGETCINLDPWAMRPDLIRILAERHASGDRLLAVEGMMGLFDAAADRRGSPADLAAMLGLPVVLVVDCARMAHSVAALVEGFNGHRADVLIAGVILNRVAGARHEEMLREALEPSGVPVLGAVRQDKMLALPSRHLGLVQATEHERLESFIADAAFAVTVGVDLDQLAALTTVSGDRDVRAAVPRLPPLGQHIAVARDAAFGFIYPHILQGWQRQGAELSFFSPLADEAPAEDADAVYLPGGYPELNAGRIVAAGNFLAGLKRAAETGKPVFGECGGYMVLGEGLIDADGARHEMAGLLPLVTSYARQRRHLGYRRLAPLAASPWQLPLTAHEFHYSTVVSEGEGERLFAVTDARGAALDNAGLRRGTVCGSYMHIIDRADP